MKQAQRRLQWSKNIEQKCLSGKKRYLKKAKEIEKCPTHVNRVNDMKKKKSNSFTSIVNRIGQTDTDNM